MNEATLGNWALTVLGGLIVALAGGVSVYALVFRASKARIYERFKDQDEKFSLRIEQLEKQFEKDAAVFEQRLYGRLALVEMQEAKLEDKLGDGVHDLEKMDTAQGVQIAVLVNTVANIEAMIGRLEGVVTTSATLKTDQFTQLMDAIKAKR